ncbi:MAG: acetyl-CoA carboxylase, biotin carboxyl carrier protein [Candidatus Omnitrophica bacterium CG11_big_fil_rev_8_21_14_0_20_42_13]|uniref:Biotin carboxyl carrier protein of acetyl-CoA carboxylase n=1 Tax=Candidatus Ghiorseimicrobium undicola TaxID=1974746 RepID=A0A2H0M2I5_9BACT|nr:MAG: acetyl-CoA carboxylase, biotin carboxyl carrier protein [Candidatus Omnitrophica bacterium CG11_big_fil_rev_8_21_14_0_20_42_13]
MNLKEIKEMINLMNENDLTELEIEKEGLRVKLSKASASVSGQPAPVFIEKERLDSAARETERKEAAKTNVQEIKAPMVGTFYRAPSPEAPPFIEAGQTVEIGQVVCIIEAMKLMNEIKSEIRGKITEVLVENAEPVEFNQPMFLVEPI